ncbi:Armadillo repeat-containing protein 4 [Nowakowskiella sp. JEL0407]|nr:Armadillo repeat-containing protein 4 [Nowakowskiella sp. JEL0407]
MGSTLSSLIEWTAIDTNNTAESYLKTSMINHDLLHELVNLVETLCKKHPTEAKTEFKRPITWISTLNLSHFPTPQWTTQTKGNLSLATLEDDSTISVSLEKISGIEKHRVSVNCFDALKRVLRIAEDHKLRELQEIIQSNRDPLNIICGAAASNDDTLLQLFDSIANESDKAKKDRLSSLYKLLLVLNSYDLDLMKLILRNLEKHQKLDVEKVSNELKMLQEFCGKDKHCALMSINWESDYTFSNGCRAPPWRQIHGELGYIEVKLLDRERIIVTACKQGYFTNGGYVADGKGGESLDYKSNSDVFPSLTELLSAQSKHFASQILNQEYHFHPQAHFVNEIPVQSAVAAELANSSEKVKEDDSSDDNKEETEYSNTKTRKKTGQMKKRDKNNSKVKKISEPSLKWRTLGFAYEGKDESAKKHPSQTSANHKEHSKRGARSGKKVNNAEDTDSDSDVVSDEEAQEKRQENSELPSEYYQIQKLVKYLRIGNQNATIIAICSLRDFDLTNEFNQHAIRDVGGLETLVNLLDTDDPKCKIGALKILKEISRNVSIRSAISDLNGMQPLVELLRDPDEELKCLAAETIAYCAKNAHNRSSVRKYGGIKKLVRLLKARVGSNEEKVAISGALALASCSKSSKNKEAIQAAGAIPLLANLLISKNEELLIPVVAILQECASKENYRVAIRSSGMIKFLVENLSSKNEELQTHCASAIFKCAEEDETRDLVREFEGLTPLVNLLDNPSNKELLVAATGAVWKCAQNLENVAALNKLNTIKKLVGLMENQPEDVLVNVVGALGACAKTADGRQAIRESGGITPLVNLLTGTNQSLLVNVTTAVGECAIDADSMAIIDRLDGVRLLWSLLKSANHHVQASAAWAISPCIEHAKDAGEMVRSFVGGLELIVSLLKSEHTEVLASVCAAIANIAKDEENLAVITDHGVVPMLAKLTNTRNDKLRKHLAEAIARCCHWGNNRVAFGTASAVAPLVKYLKSPDDQVHRSTARALHQLSMDPDNCITMHENGVVQLLLGMVGSIDPALQEAAAGTIGNIRRLALASEKAALS